MILCALAFVVCAMVAQEGTGQSRADVVPTLVLAYDGSGDFGPETPGTQTAGWQEALNACVDQGQDLYVKGGFGGRKAIYHVQDTIHIPPAQDFRIDGGVYVVNWTGPPEKDLMHIDSSMNCEYHFGILVYGGTQAGMRIRPEGPVPIDGFPVVVETTIQCQGIADPHPFTRQERRGGTGLVLDGTQAAIVHSDFYFAAVLNFHTCIQSMGAFAHNEFVCPHLHTNADRSTLWQMGDGSQCNWIRTTLGVDQGAQSVTGLVLAGSRNSVELGLRRSDAPFPPGQALVFQTSAEGNQVNLLAPDAIDVEAMVADKALVPTNQLTWAGAPSSIRQLELSPGPFEYTQRLYPAVVRLVDGQVSSVQVIRGEEAGVDYGSVESQDILLSVGDRLRVKCVEATTFTIRPLKVR